MREHVGTAFAEAVILSLVVYGFESPDWSGAIWVGLIWFLVAFLRERGRDARVLRRLEAEARKREHDAAA